MTTSLYTTGEYLLGAKTLNDLVVQTGTSQLRWHSANGLKEGSTIRPIWLIGLKSSELFLNFLGAEIGNHALKGMAAGGIYLGEGIPPRILSALKNPP